LRESEFVAVWLTRNAVSRWVTKEWQAKLSQEIAARKVVVPLLRRIDVFLARNSTPISNVLEDGLAQLLRTLRRKTKLASAESATIPSSVVENVRTFSAILTRARFRSDDPQPQARPGAEGHSARAFIRLETIQPPIPIRSIYDHILSVAHSAEVLLAELHPPLVDHDLLELARVIAYHDLCGDSRRYPAVHAPDAQQTQTSEVSAQVRLSPSRWQPNALRTNSSECSCRIRAPLARDGIPDHDR
jgi:hypothetical protein